MYSLFLHNNSNVYIANKILIRAADAPRNAGLTPRSSTHDLMDSIRYEDVASVIRMCYVSIISYALSPPCTKKSKKWLRTRINMSVSRAMRVLRLPIFSGNRRLRVANRSTVTSY